MWRSSTNVHIADNDLLRGVLEAVFLTVLLFPISSKGAEALHYSGNTLWIHLRVSRFCCLLFLKSTVFSVQRLSTNILTYSNATRFRYSRPLRALILNCSGINISLFYSLFIKLFATALLQYLVRHLPWLACIFCVSIDNFKHVLFAVLLLSSLTGQDKCPWLGQFE